MAESVEVDMGEIGNKPLSLTFGSLAPTIESQLKCQRLPLTSEYTFKFQCYADAISCLLLGGLISGRVADMARQRLADRIGKAVRSNYLEATQDKA